MKKNNISMVLASILASVTLIGEVCATDIAAPARIIATPNVSSSIEFDSTDVASGSAWTIHGYDSIFSIHDHLVEPTELYDFFDTFYPVLQIAASNDNSNSFIIDVDGNISLAFDAFFINRIR